MNYVEFLMMVLGSIFSLPVKGIIYAEEQFLQWHIVLGGVYLQRLMPTIITILAIYFVIMTVFANRQHPFHGGHHHFGNILHHIWRFVVTIVFAWFFLLYGVVAGNNEQAQRSATTTYTYRRRFGRMFEGVNTFTRVSLHFRLGRWLYNILYRVLGHIPALERNARVHRIVALTIALVICLWGVWNIPYDLTH